MTVVAVHLQRAVGRRKALYLVHSVLLSFPSESLAEGVEKTDLKHSWISISIRVRARW